MRISPIFKDKNKIDKIDTMGGGRVGRDGNRRDQVGEAD